jgi:outer membrane lipoprotein LolB
MNVVLRAKNTLNSLLSKVFFYFCVCFLVAGCVTPPPEPRPFEYRYRCAGRFTVVNDAQAFSASYELSQYPTRFEIEFWGLFGQGRTRLIGRNESLTIDLPSGERIVGANAGALMIQVLGWSVPLDALSNWVQGRPADEWPVTNHVSDSFNQLGWHIDLARWRKSSGRHVPGKVVAVRGDSKIVLLIHKWMFGAVAH